MSCFKVREFAMRTSQGVELQAKGTARLLNLEFSWSVQERAKITF